MRRKNMKKKKKYEEEEKYKGISSWFEHWFELDF